MTGDRELALAALREQVRQWTLTGPPLDLPDEGELLARIFADDNTPPP